MPCMVVESAAVFATGGIVSIVVQHAGCQPGYGLPTYGGTGVVESALLFGGCKVPPETCSSAGLSSLCCVAWNNIVWLWWC